MNHDILEQLYITRRRLTSLIVQTATTSVTAEELGELMTQRDRVVWSISQLTAAKLVASLAETEKAVAGLEKATTELEHLKSTSADIAKAIDIAKTVVSVASSIAAAVL